MTSFADLVRARWHSLAEPDDPARGLSYDAVRKHFERSRHAMAAVEAS